MASTDRSRYPRLPARASSLIKDATIASSSARAAAIAAASSTPAELRRSTRDRAAIISAAASQDARARRAVRRRSHDAGAGAAKRAAGMPLRPRRACRQPRAPSALRARNWSKAVRARYPGAACTGAFKPLICVDRNPDFEASRSARRRHPSELDRGEDASRSPLPAELHVLLSRWNGRALAVRDAAAHGRTGPDSILGVLGRGPRHATARSKTRVCPCPTSAARRAAAGVRSQRRAVADTWPIVDSTSDGNEERLRASHFDGWSGCAWPNGARRISQRRSRSISTLQRGQRQSEIRPHSAAAQPRSRTRNAAAASRAAPLASACQRAACRRCRGPTSSAELAGVPRRRRRARLARRRARVRPRRAGSRARRPRRA